MGRTVPKDNNVGKYYVDKNGDLCLDMASIGGKVVKAKVIGCINEHWFKMKFGL